MDDESLFADLKEIYKVVEESETSSCKSSSICSGMDTLLGHTELTDEADVAAIDEGYYNIPSPATKSRKHRVASNAASKSDRKRNWTPKDDNSIFAAIQKHGCKWRAIARELRIGSDDAIRNRALRLEAVQSDRIPPKTLDILKSCMRARKSHPCEAKSTHRPYTLQEDAVIRNYLKGNDGPRSWQSLREESLSLSLRTVHSIRNRAYRLENEF